MLCFSEEFERGSNCFQKQMWLRFEEGVTVG